MDLRYVCLFRHVLFLLLVELLHTCLDRSLFSCSLLFPGFRVSLGCSVDGNLLVLLADRLDRVHGLLYRILGLQSSFGISLGTQLLDLIVVLLSCLNNVVSLLLLQEKSYFLLLTGLLVGLALHLE